MTAHEAYLKATELPSERRIKRAMRQIHRIIGRTLKKRYTNCKFCSKPPILKAVTILLKAEGYKISSYADIYLVGGPWIEIYWTKPPELIKTEEYSL